MAESLKVRVFDLFAEFPTHTFGIGSSFPSARAIPTGSFQSFFDDFYHFFIGIV